MNLTGKILIVDDEERIRFFLSEILINDGHQVEKAENGTQALTLINRQEFDLALLDLNLPDMSGMDVLAALKKQSPETSAIILTAHASLETSIEALRQGTHDYLFKPCHASELRTSIQRGLVKRQKLLEQRRLVGQLTQLTNAFKEIQQEDSLPLSANYYTGQSATPQPDTFLGKPDPVDEFDDPKQDEHLLQHDDLVVDRIRYIITCKDIPLQLSSTEYNLLAYLIDQAPRIIPAQELVVEVLEYESHGGDANDVVRQHIHRLRRKIKEATGASQIIRTVRSVGYTVA